MGGIEFGNGEREVGRVSAEKMHLIWSIGATTLLLFLSCTLSSLVFHMHFYVYFLITFFFFKPYKKLNLKLKVIFAK